MELAVAERGKEKEGLSLVNLPEKLLFRLVALSSNRNTTSGEGISGFEEFAAEFINPGNPFFGGNSVSELEDDFTPYDWLKIAKHSAEGSNLRELSLRKVENSIMDSIGKIIHAPGSPFEILSVADISALNLHDEQPMRDLLDLLMSSRACPALEMEYYCGNEFWEESITSNCVAALLNSMILFFELDIKDIKNIKARILRFSESARQESINRYGRGP